MGHSKEGISFRLPVIRVFSALFFLLFLFDSPRAETVFSDGFEGTWPGSWTVVPNCRQSSNFARTGTYSAELDAQTGSITYSFTTLHKYLGASDILLTWWYRNDNAYEADDCDYLDIYDGSWNLGEWSHCNDLTTWTQGTRDLDNNGYTLTGSFQIRFRHGTDANDEEGYFDDVSITATRTAATITAPAKNGFDDNSLSIDYTLPFAAAAGTVKMSFIGVSGDAATHTIIFDSPSMEGAGRHTATLRDCE